MRPRRAGRGFRLTRRSPYPGGDLPATANIPHTAERQMGRSGDLPHLCARAAAGQLDQATPLCLHLDRRARGLRQDLPRPRLCGASNGPESLVHPGALGLGRSDLLRRFRCRAQGHHARRVLLQYSADIQDPVAFARAYFKRAFAHLRGPHVLVLDDYQEVAPGAPLHGVIATLIATLPPDTRLIVLSRAAPPPALARARRMIWWRASGQKTCA